MRVGPVFLDASRATLMACCHECPMFREVRTTRPAALLAAADHAQRVHGQDGLAAHLRELAKRNTTRRQNPNDAEM